MANILPRRAWSNLPAPTKDVEAIDRMPTLVSAGPSVSDKKMVAKRDLLMVVTQMSIMVRSGVDLAEAVRNIALRAKRAPVREAMSEVYTALEAGCPLSRALYSQRERFGGVVVASVAAGEASGRLPDVLVRLSAIIRDQLRLHNSLRSVIGYPVVLSIVTILVLAAMIFFVLPQFAGIYESSRTPTPVITRLLLDGAQLVRTYWWMTAILAGASSYGTVSALRTPAGRRMWDSLLVRMPLMRQVSTCLISGRLFRLQGAMLDSGVSMLEVLKLTRPAVGNGCYEELIDEIEASVVNGEGYAVPLHDSPLIPEGAPEMIGTAESNGQLGAVLQTVGEHYESEGEQYLRDLVKIAEPAIIVVLGLVIGAVVLAVMLPLLDLSSAGRM